jgi:hypothetical protein
MIERITFRRDVADQMAAREILQVRLQDSEVSYSIADEDYRMFRGRPETCEEYGQRLSAVAAAMGQAFADAVRSELRRMGHLV